MTDLVRDLAAVVHPPEFETLVRRAGRRRARKRAVAVSVTVAAVAAAVIGAATLRPSDDVRPIPTGPSPTVTSPSEAPSTAIVHPGLPIDVDGVIRTATLIDYAVDGHGGLATEWQKCGPGAPCQYVFRVIAGGATGDGGGREEYFASANPGFISSDGALYRGHGVPLLQPTDPGSIGPRTVLLPGSSKVGLRAADPDSLTVWTLPSTGCVPGQVGWSGAMLSPGGRIWAFPAMTGPEGGHVPLCSSTDGTHWHLAVANLNPDPAAGPGQVVAVGSHVAALSAGDDGMPANPFWVSQDDGAHFAKVSGLPFDRVDSMAATADGVLYVAAMDGTLYRSTNWSTFTKVTAAPLANLRADGSQVAAQISSMDPRLVTVTGDGTVTPWPTPLR